MSIQVSSSHAYKQQVFSAALEHSLASLPNSFDASQLHRSLQNLNYELAHLSRFLFCSPAFSSSLSHDSLDPKKKYLNAGSMSCGAGPINTLCKIADNHYLAGDTNGQLVHVAYLNGSWRLVSSDEKYSSGISRIQLISDTLCIAFRDGQSPTLHGFSAGTHGALQDHGEIRGLDGLSLVGFLEDGLLVGVRDSSVVIFRIDCKVREAQIQHESIASGARPRALVVLPDRTFLTLHSPDIADSDGATRAENQHICVRKWLREFRSWKERECWSSSPLPISDTPEKASPTAWALSHDGDVWMGQAQGAVTCYKGDNTTTSYGVLVTSSVARLRPLLGGKVLVVGEDGSMRVLDVYTSETSPLFRVKKHEVRDVHVSDTGDIVTVGSDSAIRFWQCR